MKSVKILLNTLLLGTLLLAKTYAANSAPIVIIRFIPGTISVLVIPPQKQLLKIWAPMASEVTLRLFDNGDKGPATISYPLQKEDNGVWLQTVSQDLKNKYYTFQVKQDGKWAGRTS